MNLVLGLSPGKIAFYDPVSRMHFHLGNPVQAVPKGVDTKKLHQAVKFKTLFVLEGSFDAKEDKAKAEKPAVKQDPKADKSPAKEPAKEQKTAEKEPSSKTKEEPKTEKPTKKTKKAEPKKDSDKVDDE